MNNLDALIPSVAVITDIREDTPDVKTFRVTDSDGNKPLFTNRASALCYLFPE